MHGRLTVMIVALMHVLAVAFFALFLWIWLSTYQDIAEQKLVIDTQTGLRYLLLPLILPILHIMSIVGCNIRSSTKSGVMKRQGDLFVVAVVVLFALGWFLEVRYFSLLEKSEYQPCDNRSSGIRSVFITYTKDTSLCPM